MSKFNRLFEDTFGPGNHCFKTTVTDISPGRFRVGKEDLYDMIEELKSLRAQDEADDWADNGFDDGEDDSEDRPSLMPDRTSDYYKSVVDDGVERCPSCGIDLDFEQHDNSCTRGL